MRKNVSMMFTGMVIGAALTGGSIAAAAGITADLRQPIFVDGQQVEMEAYNIAGLTYVKLQGHKPAGRFPSIPGRRVQIDTGHPYTGIALAASGIASAAKGAAPSAPEPAAA